MAISKPIAFTILAGVLGGAWWLLRTPPVVAPESAAPPPASKPEVPAPAPLTGAVEKEPAKEVPVEGRLRMPDGSYVAALNGVLQPATIVWGDVPWSPVVRKQVDANIEWYVHADGTYTTTMMQWRSDLGRKDAVTLCLHPTKAAPTEPPDGEGGAAKKQ